MYMTWEYTGGFEEFEILPVQNIDIVRVVSGFRNFARTEYKYYTGGFEKFEIPPVQDIWILRMGFQIS